MKVLNIEFANRAIDSTGLNGAQKNGAVSVLPFVPGPRFETGIYLKRNSTDRILTKAGDPILVKIRVDAQHQNRIY